jgi:protein-histidine pros-kinase
MDHFSPEELFPSQGFMPHGMCYLWQPGVLSLHVLSDGLITLAYLSIPFTLTYFVRKRTDLQFNWMYLCFAVFIVACGATHVMEIWTIWYPTYWLSGGIKAITALASVATAVLLIKLIPEALRLPSASALQNANAGLAREVGVRIRAEEDLRQLNAALEVRVAERTAQLEALNRTLVQDNARFAMAADAVGLGFWELNIEANTLQCDERVFRLYGRSPEEGMQPYALWASSVHPEDLGRCEQELADALHGRVALDTEFRIIRPNGTVRHLRAMARTTHTGDGEAARMLGVSFDITASKRADERFRLAIDAAPTGMLLMDRIGCIVLVNAQIESLFGYARDELLGRRIEMLVPERFRLHHPDFRKTFFGDPNAREMGAGRDLYGLRKDGSEVPIEIGLNPLHTSEGDFVLSSIVDITERKRATEHFRLALEAAPTGMLLMDETGKIVLVNAQIEKLFGYHRSELLGRQIDVLVPERFRTHHPALRQGFFSAPKARVMGAGRDLYGLRKDGSEVPVEIGLNPLQTSAGEFVLSSIIDLSQRREMDRLRTDFVSTVSHELRTPLTSISGSLGLLQSGAMGVLPEKVAGMVRIAYKNSGRLVRIINDILDIGRLEAGQLALQMVSVSLAELLQQSVEVNAGYAEKCEVRFVLDAGSADDRVMVDPDRLMQVVTNILSNAAKFSPPGCDVLIRVRPGPTSIRVEVEDSGPGISEAFKGRIFEKFAQADASATRRFEGSGLGLSIARKLIEAMGGTIDFTTVPGRGTIFYIELPRIDATLTVLRNNRLSETAAHQVLLTANATADGPNTVVPRLLYVENDEDLISVIRAGLGGRADIVPAHSLREAERLLREQNFDLVILDQSLSDGNGLSLVDRIPTIVGHSVPIVIFSASSVPNEMRRQVSAVLIKSQVSAAQAAATILSYLPLPRPETSQRCSV